MSKHIEDDCKVPFCDECLARIKQVKKLADDIRSPTCTPASQDNEIEKWWFETNGTGEDSCPACSNSTKHICTWHTEHLSDLEKLIKKRTLERAINELNGLHKELNDETFLDPFGTSWESNRFRNAWRLKQLDTIKARLSTLHKELKELS